MNKFDFNIGATVHCKNGKCGKLQKIVVDPESMEVTDLIVSKGLILTEDRVVPVSDVDRATEDYVMLSVNDTQLEEYPEYRTYNFDVAHQKSKRIGWYWLCCTPCIPEWLWASWTIYTCNSPPKCSQKCETRPRSD